MASLNSNTRVAPPEVRDIFDTDLTNDELSAYINMAAEIVDVIVEEDVNNTLSGRRLKLIELNLSAHYATTRDPRVSREKIGDAQFDYRGPKDTTLYWETALGLDTTNTLSRDNKPSANISVLNSRGLD